MSRSAMFDAMKIFHSTCVVTKNDVEMVRVKTLDEGTSIYVNPERFVKKIDNLKTGALLKDVKHIINEVFTCYTEELSAVFHFNGKEICCKVTLQKLGEERKILLEFVYNRDTNTFYVPNVCQQFISSMLEIILDDVKEHSIQRLDMLTHQYELTIPQPWLEVKG